MINVIESQPLVLIKHIMNFYIRSNGSIKPTSSYFTIQLKKELKIAPLYSNKLLTPSDIYREGSVCGTLNFLASPTLFLGFHQIPFYANHLSCYSFPLPFHLLV